MKKEINLIRYGFSSEEGPLVEKTKFVRCGFYEGTSENDERSFKLLGQEGNWIWFTIDGFLGNQIDIKNYMHPYLLPLREGVSLIKKEVYDAYMCIYNLKQVPNAEVVMIK